MTSQVHKSSHELLSLPHWRVTGSSIAGIRFAPWSDTKNFWDGTTTKVWNRRPKKKISHTVKLPYAFLLFDTHQGPGPLVHILHTILVTPIALTSINSKVQQFCNQIQNKSSASSRNPQEHAFWPPGTVCPHQEHLLKISQKWDQK